MATAPNSALELLRRRRFLKTRLKAQEAGITLIACGTCRHYQDGMPYGHCRANPPVPQILYSLGHWLSMPLPEPPHCTEWDVCGVWRQTGEWV